MRQLEEALDLRACLTGIIDYAGLFPPAALGSAAAVSEYLSLQSDVSYQWLFRRFVLPMAPELRRRELLQRFQDELRQRSTQVPVAVLLPSFTQMEEVSLTFREFLESCLATPSGNGSVETGILVESLEFSLPVISSLSLAELSQLENFLHDFSRCCGQILLYIEQDWKELDLQCLELFAQLRQRYPFLHLKIRTGGLTSEAVPSAQLLARVIEFTVRANVPFKCTAGLHAALFETSKRFGFEMHGFINVLLAVAQAREEQKLEHIESSLKIGNHEALCARLPVALGTDWLTKMAQARLHMHSFGCCSIKEPHESLLHHRLLQPQ